MALCESAFAAVNLCMDLTYVSAQAWCMTVLVLSASDGPI